MIWCMELKRKECWFMELNDGKVAVNETDILKAFKFTNSMASYTNCQNRWTWDLTTKIHSNIDGELAINIFTCRAIFIAKRNFPYLYNSSDNNRIFKWRCEWVGAKFIPQTTTSLYIMLSSESTLHFPDEIKIETTMMPCVIKIERYYSTTYI